jgi:hypothetical protein
MDRSTGVLPKSSFRNLARLYDIYTVLGIDPTKKVFICPLPQHIHYNYSPSFGIHIARNGRQYFRCFGNCGLYGDVIDLVGYLEIPGYSPKNPEHVRMAAARLQGSPISPPKQEQKKSTLEPGLWKKYMPPGPKILEYGRTRGLTPATLEKFKVGEKAGAMSIPVFENGQLKAIKFRSTRKNAKVRYWSEAGSVNALFNHDKVALTDRPVAVLKGEIPVMLFDQLGLLACAPTTGEERSDMSEWKHLFAFSVKKIVITDNDPDPIIRARIVAKAAMRAAQIGAELRFPPEQFKDVDEWILADPNAIQTIRDWLNSEQEEITYALHELPAR